VYITLPETVKKEKKKGFIKRFVWNIAGFFIHYFSVRKKSEFSPIFNQNSFPSILQHLFSDDVITGVRARQPVTHMTSVTAIANHCNDPTTRFTFLMWQNTLYL